MPEVIEARRLALTKLLSASSEPTANNNANTATNTPNKDSSSVAVKSLDASAGSHKLEKQNAAELNSSNLNNINSTNSNLNGNASVPNGPKPLDNNNENQQVTNNRTPPLYNHSLVPNGSSSLRATSPYVDTSSGGPAQSSALTPSKTTTGLNNGTFTAGGVYNSAPNTGNIPHHEQHAIIQIPNSQYENYVKNPPGNYR